MNRSDENAAGGASGSSPASEEEPYVSPVPGCILLAIGAMMVLLLAIGWLF